MIAKNPHITRNELANRVGLNMGGIKYQITELTKKGIIQRLGSSRNGYWKIVQ